MPNFRSPASSHSRSRPYSQSWSKSQSRSNSRLRSQSRSMSLSPGASSSCRGRDSSPPQPNPSRQNRRHHSRSGSAERSISRSTSYSQRTGRNRSRTRSRSRSPFSERHNSTKIAVERLASNVNEGHLHEIFSQFGAIDDFDLPKTNLGLNRGTAYIIYLNEDDAETAITHMHEAQIDSATINVSIVPRDSKFHYFPPLAQHHESSGHNRNNGGGSYRRQPPIDPNTSRGSGRERERHGADIYRPGECEKMKTPTPRRKIGKSLTSGSDAKRPKDN